MRAHYSVDGDDRFLRRLPMTTLPVVPGTHAQRITYIIRYYYSDNAKQARHVPAQYGISYYTNIHIVYVNAEVTRLLLLLLLLQLLLLLLLPNYLVGAEHLVKGRPANARAPNNICMNPFVDTSGARALAYIGPE